MSDILWEPSAERIAATHLKRFMERLPGVFETYDDLWRWSIDDRAGFWQAVWDHGGVIASQAAESPLGSDTMPGAEWFRGARLNFAENLLRHTNSGSGVIAAGEGRPLRHIGGHELRSMVAAAQEGLESLGVGPGDRVAALLPNSEHAVVGMLAVASIGAVWSSCSPDFGPGGIVDRFGQIEPTVLITTDGYRYNGKVLSVRSTVRSALERLEGVRRVVEVDFVGEALGEVGAPIMAWDELLSGNRTEPIFAQLPFDHPLYILYSSGTTGPPKSIVHGAGGTLLKHLSEQQLHCDMHPGDRAFWFTTCGWMMWNWLAGTLATGAIPVLYDGSPSHPDLGALWRLAADSAITHFGTSPRFLAANANAGIVPRDIADLGSLRWLGSTGAPLNSEQFDWVYANVSADLHLASISGGTDIIGCFAAGVPTLAVRRGEIQARVLGMAVEAWDGDGKPAVGTKGELVCTRPFVSMPVSFWKDPGGDRYHNAYFSQYPGVWVHGDYIEIRPTGGVVIHGRSDTTLTPGGVRIGTAEIYRAIETMAEIEDAIVVGHVESGDVTVALFVKLTAGWALSSDLVDRIKEAIRRRNTPRHVPRHVVAVDDIPYTLSGKKVEKAVARVLAGEKVTNRDALANPESLDLYEGLL